MLSFVRRWPTPLVAGAVAACCLSSACSRTGALSDVAATTTTTSRSYGYGEKDRECLTRAMFFESRRSSRPGLIAVGTVVMNRLESQRHGDTLCEVVGQKGQFAPGVLTRPMDAKSLPDVQEAADAVLRGERHPEVKNAMFFHQASLKFPYRNMHYVLVAGGNAFYEKRGRTRAPSSSQEPAVAIAAAADVDNMTVASIRAGQPERGSERADGAPPIMSFDVGQEQADAIAAIIAGQDKPR